jgi:uncharacterized protein YkwD
MKSFWFFALLFFFTALVPPFPGVGWGEEGKKIPFVLQQGDPGKPLSSEELNREIEKFIVERSNEIRGEKKLEVLEQNEILAKAGRDHSMDMLKKDYFSHFSPDGKSVVDRVKKYVAEPRTSLGENVHVIYSGRGLQDPQAISRTMVDDWMRSKSHRENILAKKYTQTGVGCANDGFKVYCTQVFSGPKL